MNPAGRKPVTFRTQSRHTVQIRNLQNLEQTQGTNPELRPDAGCKPMTFRTQIRCRVQTHDLQNSDQMQGAIPRPSELRPDVGCKSMTFRTQSRHSLSLITFSV